MALTKTKARKERREIAVMTHEIQAQQTGMQAYRYVSCWEFHGSSSTMLHENSGLSSIKERNRADRSAMRKTVTDDSSHYVWRRLIMEVTFSYRKKGFES
uniref:Uncharacterized protein n=1 Tax=Salix viminalis TaxID=40686 RepID=A0A6N2KVQ1_SALVM